MRRIGVLSLCSLVLLALLLAACEGYTQTGARSSSQQSGTGGGLRVEIGKANGSAEESIEVEGGSGLTLEAEVMLSVQKGTFKIELLGEDDQVTLSLEARDGQTVGGQGQMVVDTFDEASYRVTATEAEDVVYTIEYVYR